MQRIAVIISAAVLAGAGGFVVAHASDSKVASTTSASASGFGGGMPGGARGGGGPDLSALADDLNVSVAKLRAAMDKARSSAGNPSAMAKTLAASLGLSEATVSKALQANRPSGGMGAGGQPPSGTVPRGGTPPAQGGVTTSQS